MNNSARHGKCRYACCTNHGIDFVFGEEVDKLCKKHATGSVENESKKTETQNEKCLSGEEKLCLHLEGNCYAKENGDEVCKNLLSCFGKRIEHTTLTDEITKHEEADK